MVLDSHHLFNHLQTNRDPICDMSVVTYERWCHVVMSPSGTGPDPSPSMVSLHRHIRFRSFDVLCSKSVYTLRPHTDTHYTHNRHKYTYYTFTDVYTYTKTRTRIHYYVHTDVHTNTLLHSTDCTCTDTCTHTLAYPHMVCCGSERCRNDSGTTSRPYRDRGDGRIVSSVLSTSFSLVVVSFGLSTLWVPPSSPSRRTSST